MKLLGKKTWKSWHLQEILKTTLRERANGWQTGIRRDKRKDKIYYELQKQGIVERYDYQRPEDTRHIE